MGSTKEFVEFLMDYQEREKEDEIIQESKKHLIDLVGAMLRGIPKVSSKPVFEMMAGKTGREESTALGLNRKIQTVDAAFVNGVLAHTVEIDDTHLPSSLHPGAVIVPTTLAVAEREGIGGKELLNTIITGYEAIGRIGIAIDPDAHYDHGFHPTATCGVFGSATATGLLIDLDKDQLINTYGIAGSMASGLLEFRHSGSWIKRFHPGLASRNGIFASYIGKEGFTGPSTVLEGKSGFLSSYSDKGDPRKLLAEEGSNVITDTTIKKYACCNYIHSAILAANNLKVENNIDLENIEQIEVGTIESAIRLTYDKPKELVYEPNTSVEAQFSMPYGVAVGLIYGKALPDEFGEEIRTKQEVLELAKKVSVRHDENLEELFPEYFPARVEITLDSGEEYSTMVKAPPGHPERKMSMEQLEEKFHGLTEKVMDREASEELFEKLQEIEEIEDVSEITDLISVQRE